MNSRTGSAAINYVLTAYAQGLANDLLQQQAVVDALMPVVAVGGATGQFKKFDDENSFRVYGTQRGMGGSAKRIEFGADDATFACEPQALEVTVDDHERDLSAVGGNPLAGQLLDQGKIRALINSKMLSHVNKVVNFVLDNATAVADRGNWSNPNIDPIAQLDEQLELLSNDVGSTSFINLVLSTGAWRALRNHPKVIARCTGVQVAGISQGQLEAMLLFPVKLVIGAVSKLSSNPGATAAKTNVVGSNALLTYSVPGPTQYDPTAFKCFTVGSGMVGGVRTYRDEKARSDVHATDWSEDMKKTSSLSVKRLAIS